MDVEALNTKLVRRTLEGDNCLYYVFCPGCQRAHIFEVPRWSFNGNHEKPTFSPSLRVYIRNPQTNQETTLCHFNLNNGVFEFHSDSSDHQLRGAQPMVDFPKEYTFGSNDQPFKDS